MIEEDGLEIIATKCLLPSIRHLALEVAWWSVMQLGRFMVRHAGNLQDSYDEKVVCPCYLESDSHPGIVPGSREALFWMVEYYTTPGFDAQRLEDLDTDGVAEIFDLKHVSIPSPKRSVD